MCAHPVLPKELSMRAIARHSTTTHRTVRQEWTAGDPAKCTCPERIETAGGQVEASLWDSLAV
jgi:hypothetical protein